MKALFIGLAILTSSAACAQEDEASNDLYNHYLDATSPHTNSSPDWGRDAFVNTPSGEIWICTSDQFGHLTCR